MARDFKSQHFSRGHDFIIDYGVAEFTTTGATVELVTNLSEIWGVVVTPCQAMDTPETFYLNETVSGVGDTYTNSGPMVIGLGGEITLTRVAKPLYFSGVGSTDYIAGNEYVEVPIGVCEVAGVLNEAWYYNLVKNGGSPLINIGNVPTNGTGTADPNAFLANAKAEAAPDSSVGKSITDFTATAVGADDLITFTTTGSSSSDPSGGWCQVKITPTLTSGLVFSYQLIGLD